MLFSASSFGVPTRTVRVSTTVCTPPPAMALNWLYGSIASCRSFAPSTIALARGCSESVSAVAATCSNLASSSPIDFPGANTTKSVTAALPSVSVPVLSKMMACIFEACSRAVAFLIRMPFLAPMPVPTATAVGVARPSASGQAITMAVTASVSAKRAVCPITKNQIRKVSTPALTAARTNHSAARSASR